MKILSAKQIHEVDSCTIENEPIRSVDLMERAGAACAGWIAEKYDKSYRFAIIAGLGNNGGDGLVIARLLAEKGYGIEVWVVRYSDNCSPDFLVNFERVKKISPIIVRDIAGGQFPLFPDGEINNCIFIDAIFGSGLNRPLDGLAAAVVKHINGSGACILSIDIPSGLFADNNSENNFQNIIQANWTLSLQLPKLSFLFAEHEKQVGSWVTIPIGLNQECINLQETDYYYITHDHVRSIFKPRRRFSHKGAYGHALLVAGSHGMMGAAVLAARACLRSGVGLLTALVPQCGYTIIQRAVPECLALVSDHEKIISGDIDVSSYSAVGVGPGLGKHENTAKTLLKIIKKAKSNLVVDADAINILAGNKSWIAKLPHECILTPHPGEFARIVGVSTSLTAFKRVQMQVKFSKKHKVYVVLKGRHTSISTPEGKCWFNSTGNPGMATGGSGDVLTGIITGLLAQGYKPLDACIAGVYLHGLAGDIAVQPIGQEALVAGDIVNSMGQAFMQLKLLS